MRLSAAETFERRQCACKKHPVSITRAEAGGTCVGSCMAVAPVYGLATLVRLVRRPLRQDWMLGIVGTMGD